MKDTLLLFISALILTLLLLMALPWWSTVVVGLLIGALSQLKGIATFVTVFFAAFLAWGASAWWQDSHYVKSVAEMLANMGLGSSVYAFLMTAVVGGLTASLAAALSWSLRRGIA